MDDGGKSRRAPMRPLDPILLGSFPAPPTHIPPTPTSPNPPPSRPPSSPLPPLPARSHRANESISSIDVRDILHAAISSDEESPDDGKLAALPPLARNSLPARNPKHVLSLADPIDPETIIPIARSFTFPTPRRTVFSPSSPPRSSSPDIAAIISATPRPRANSLHKKATRPAVKRRASEGLPYVAVTTSSPYGVYRHSNAMDALPSDDDDTRSWIDHDEFGRPLPPPSKSNKPDWSAEEESRFAELERQLEGSDSDASDSSLDIHTPLPHLMMRHGLLSPQSRLITQPSARDSLVSLASPTSAHPLKDARDTVKRRVRHRDGRLLKGGIGLTTGLGWSDSEDEGAPSALTRRISSLNLTGRSSLTLSRSTTSLSSTPSRSSSSNASLPSRKSSSASKHSSRPFARSYASTTSLRISDHTTPDVDEFGKITTSPITRKPSRGSAKAIPEGEETSSADENTMDTFSRYTGRNSHLAELEHGARLNREKSLPPLPRSSVASTRSMPPPPPPRSIGLARSVRSDSAGATEGRSRSISSASSTQQQTQLASARATITKVVYNPPKSSTPDSRTGTGTGTSKTPRPLRITSPPSPPVPLLLHHRHVPQLGIDTPHTRSPLLESLPSTPSPSTPSPVTPARPRPRVGTGMTYRASSGASRIRGPSLGSSSVRSLPPLGMQKPIIPL